MVGTVGIWEIVLAGAIGLEPTAFGFGEPQKFITRSNMILKMFRIRVTDHIGD